jgi:hypothetical protein
VAAGKGGGMTGLKADVDPAEVGFDPRRLERVDRHFARYVDDGRLPGWLLTVSRDWRAPAAATWQRGCRCAAC